MNSCFKITRRTVVRYRACNNSIQHESKWCSTLHYTCCNIFLIKLLEMQFSKGIRSNRITNIVVSCFISCKQTEYTRVFLLWYQTWTMLQETWLILWGTNCCHMYTQRFILSCLCYRWFKLSLFLQFNKA